MNIHKKLALICAVLLVVVLSTSILGQDKPKEGAKKETAVVLTDSIKAQLKTAALDEQLEGVKKQYAHLDAEEMKLKAGIQEITELKKALNIQASNIAEEKKKYEQKKPEPKPADKK